MASIKLPGPVTGYSHPKCYANADGNCSMKISKEHFISASLLRRLELNNKVKIAGLASQQPENFKLLPIKGLASNILCERHNNALSGLDALIEQFAKNIHEIDKATAGQNAVYHGPDIERWILKCVIGLSVSGNIKATIKPECVDLLFGRADWPDGWGLYLNLNATAIYHTDSFLIEARTHPQLGHILAADVFIQGLPFILVMGKPGDPKTFGVWRPSEIRFQGPSGARTLSLTWDGKCSGEPVTLTRVGTYDGHPPNWKDWERNG